MVVTEGVEQVVYFHKSSQFPRGCIGPLRMNLVQQSPAVSSAKLLILYVHPSICAEIVMELRSHLTDAVQLEEVGGLSRFSLRGLQSAIVLEAILSTSSGIVDPVTQYALNLVRNSRQLNRIWKDGGSLAVTLTDPRIVTFEHSRAELTAGATVPSVSLKWPRNSSASTLWEPAALNSLTSQFRKDDEILRGRFAAQTADWENHFAAAAGADAAATATPRTVTVVGSSVILPVVLIRRKCNKSATALHSRRPCELWGWDMVLPDEWAPALWLALQFHKGTVTAVGEAEMHHLQRRAGLLSFPRDFPDTAAGEAFWRRKHADACAMNRLRPFRKRTAAPDLVALVRELCRVGCRTALTDDTTTLPPMQVVRGAGYLADFLSPEYSSDVVDHFAQALQQGAELADVLSEWVPALPALPRLTLLPVSVWVVGRGLPLDLAEILMPLPEDCDHWLRHRAAYAGRRSVGQRGLASATLGATAGGDLDLSREWRGVQLEKTSYRANECNAAGEPLHCEGRHLIGVVTSGLKPHLNNSTMVVGLCDAVSLNRLYRQSFGQYYHPLVHRLVLVRNPQSGWLRPAVIDIL